MSKQAKQDADFETTTSAQSDKKPDQKLDYPGWVEVFQSWLADTPNSEVKNLVEFFDRSGKWWAAAKELTVDEFNQSATYLKRDLMMFYHHYQQDMEESAFIQALKESAWNELAEMTDRSQIEWQELAQDFRHHGTYEQGEWVGMGEMVCKQCHYKVTFVHPVELPACPQCGGLTFLREPLAP